MGANSSIEWCDHTANLWWGCDEVHAGCDHCYARTFAKAKGKGLAWEGRRFAVGSIWKSLAKWQAAAAGARAVARVFTGSMMDIFEKPLAASDWKGNPLGLTTGDLRARYLREVVPATPDLLHLLLTKRPANAPKYVPLEWLAGWPDNVMTGASVCDQAAADVLVRQLVRLPGPLFLSLEPLLGPIDLTRLDNGGGETYDALAAAVTTHRGHSFRTSNTRPIAWVIVGGESGPGARPMDPAWVRSLRDQCTAAGVPFFFKQWGGVRKGEAGRVLDGRTWDEFPSGARSTSR
jgi:protein gp37